MNTASNEILIVKSSGEKEAFSEAKLRRSLERVKASPPIIDEVVQRIRSQLREGMPTSEIYRRAFALLRQRQRLLAARYSLKQAIMQMGPTGHPFERLVAEILKSQGFSVEVGKTVQGACVAHEVDVVAEKGQRHIMVECKFHHQSGMKSDVKVALYVQARFEDIRKARQTNAGHDHRFDEAWLVTNTKLTSDAIQYARCVDLKAIGWSYPPADSLPDLIDRANLQPVTSLTSLSKYQKSQLLDKGIILCKELVANPGILSSIGVDEARSIRVMQEARELCYGKEFE